MLVWDDWTWLIHGSVFHHHWSLPVGNIWFFAGKVSLCLSHNTEVLLGEEESTPGAGQMPVTAMYDSRAWIICPIYWWWCEIELQPNENRQLQSIDWWVSTFLYFVAHPFFQTKFQWSCEKASCSGGDTHSPLLEQFLGYLLWNTVSSQELLESHHVDQVHGPVLVNIG